MTFISEMLNSAVFSFALFGDFNARREEQRKNKTLGQFVGRSSFINRSCDSYYTTPEFSDDAIEGKDSNTNIEG